MISIKKWLFVGCWLLIVVGYLFFVLCSLFFGKYINQQSTINNQQSTINNQPTTTNNQPTTNFY